MLFVRDFLWRWKGVMCPRRWGKCHECLASSFDLPLSFINPTLTVLPLEEVAQLGVNFLDTQGGILIIGLPGQFRCPFFS
jgi:hypothetical protein